MRKIYIIALLLSGLFAVNSCQKDSGIGDGYDRFTAYQDGALTKTVLDGLTPAWTPSEQISIYDGKNNVFTAELSSPAATATFKGKLEGQGQQRQDFLAASPYNESYDFDLLTKAIYSVVMPEEQEAVNGSYDSSALLSMAYTADKNLAFKNLCSLVKFTVACDGVTSVEVLSNGQESLSGAINASWNNGEPYITIRSGKGKGRVALKGNFEKGETYYISTLPTVLNDGFTVKLNGSVVTMKETRPVSFSRSGMINIGSISLNPGENVLPDTGGNPDEGGNEGGNQGGNAGGDQSGNEGDAGLLYLDPKDWKVDSPRYEAYFFGDNNNAWAVMTDDDKDGIFECKIPDGYTNVVFCRMDPSKPENNWESKWNQTVDLVISGNMFTITDPWGSSTGGKADGTWSTKQ